MSPHCRHRTTKDDSHLWLKTRSTMADPSPDTFAGVVVVARRTGLVQWLPALATAGITNMADVANRQDELLAKGVPENAIHTMLEANRRDPEHGPYHQDGPTSPRGGTRHVHPCKRPSRQLTPTTGREPWKTWTLAYSRRPRGDLSSLAAEPGKNYARRGDYRHGPSHRRTPERWPPH